MAGDARAQEAVFLSSPDVYENVWRRFVEREPPARSDSASRRDERLVYAYVQRFCAKNETTSFFGPMGYGEIAGEDEGEEEEVACVAAGTPVRRTSVAYWAVEELAAAIAREPELWPHLPVQTNPLFVVDSATRRARCDAAPDATGDPLTPSQLRLLAVLTSPSTTAALAARLGDAAAAVEQVTGGLLARGILIRRLWFASDRADTLAGLRVALEALPPSTTRDRWAATLAHLDALRGRFETAPFGERRPLLGAIEALFVRSTGAAARRAGGRLYTDRLLLNEESSSPFRIRLGQRAAARLAHAIGPALDFCAARGSSVQEDASRRVVAALESAPLPMGFLAYAGALRAMARAEPPEEEVQADGGALQDFAHPGQDDTVWDARFALPDVCLVRDGTGVFRPVLSSLHHQLLTPGWLFRFHQEPARVDRLTRAWLDAHARVPLYELATGRHNKGYYSYPGPRAAHAPAESYRGDSPEAVVAAAACTVRIDDGRPVLCSPDGAEIRLYLPLADLTLHTPFAALAAPPVVVTPMRAPGGRTPRITIGGAVYQRARWEVDLRPWKALSGLGLFAAMDRVRVELSLPRFVFATVPAERKPFLVDTTSPLAADLLAHLGRGAARIILEEMLPSPEDLWLRDDRGRYTCELRMQATRGASPASEARAVAAE